MAPDYVRGKLAIAMISAISKWYTLVVHMACMLRRAAASGRRLCKVRRRLLPFRSGAPIYKRRSTEEIWTPAGELCAEVLSTRRHRKAMLHTKNQRGSCD